METLWNSVWDAPRPFVHPLVAPNGGVLSVESPADHPWHHGLWFAIKLVNGENFWEEYGEFGCLATVDVVRREGGATECASIEWRRPETSTVVIDETRSISFLQLSNDAYALDWRVELTPRVDVQFDRTPFTTWGGYGGLTLRGAPDFTDTVLTNPWGTHERILGDRSAWCALDGMATTTDGHRVLAGLVMIDHPSNANFPTPWYASTRAATYGDGWANFFNAAFLWDGPLTVAADQTMVREHRVVVHSGQWQQDEIVRSAEMWPG